MTEIDDADVPVTLRLGATAASHDEAARCRQVLLTDGAVRVSNLVDPAVLSEVEAQNDASSLEESWAYTDAGRAAVSCIQALLNSMFGFCLLDPYRFECTPGYSPTSKKARNWHRDNLPISAMLKSRRDCFHFRPVLFVGDVAPDMGPTELVIGSHLAAVEARGGSPDGRRVLLLGAGGDLVLFASRIYHRRCYSDDPSSRLRKLVWMLARTEAPAP